MYARGRNIVAVVICVLGLSLASADSLDAAAFQQLLGTYRTGRAQDAINKLAAWPVDRLVAAAKASTPQLSSSDRMAAAILQAEVANAWLDLHRGRYGLVSLLSPNDALKVTDVINSGLALLHDARRAPFGDRLGDEPRRSWYYAVASSLVASILLPEASALIDAGLKAFPDDPLLVTARGTIAAGHPRMRFHSTKAALADYQRALALAPDLAIIKLRLGQLYVDLGSGREAARWLQSVASGASTDDQRYLAHLLLGRIAAAEHDLEMSDAEYFKAYRLGAGYQAACIALSRSEEVLEHPERAADIAEDCFRLSEHDDPWPYYHAMGDPDALPHLRAEARCR